MTEEKLLNPWDNIFAQHGKYFTEPHEDMPGIVQQLRAQNAQTVLDLGCGTGRHVVYLAGQGFTVYGLDSAPEGLQLTEAWLAEESLSARLQLQDMMDPLPYEKDFFDALISTQVIHHGDVAAIKQLIAEIERVLKPNGLLFVTVPKVKNQAKTFKQIEENTFIPLDGPEKGLPHHYFSPEELRDFFSNFAVSTVHLDVVEHYCLLGLKIAD